MILAKSISPNRSVDVTYTPAAGLRSEAVLSLPDWFESKSKGERQLKLSAARKPKLPKQNEMSGS